MTRRINNKDPEINLEIKLKKKNRGIDLKRKIGPPRRINKLLAVVPKEIH